MYQPIGSLDLPEYKLKHLHSKGHIYCEDVNVKSLNNEIAIAEEHWKQLLRVPPVKSALDLLHEESFSSHIITFCQELDEVLDKGVPTKLITEFNGMPGSGKTQMCLQLCASVQLPACFGGLDGKAVYIDTNPGFSVQRFEEIINGCISQCVLLSEKYNSNEMMMSLKKLSTQNLMEGLYYLRATKFLELLSTLRLLKRLLNDDSAVKLIVVDSITKPFRRAQLDGFEKTKILYQFSGELQKLAETHNVAIVFTNDLTTKFDESGSSYTSPSLGDSYSHRINTRINLKRTSDHHFTANLVKSPLKPPATVGLKIVECGVRGLV